MWLVTDPTSTGWHDFGFVVQMPHLAPGGRLSEVEFLKVLGAFQWEAIARCLGARPSQITSSQGERLYASFIDLELKFAGGHSPQTLGEDVTIHVKNRACFYAKKLVEGLFVFDDRPISDRVLESIRSRDDLASSGHSWACMTNALIAREGGANTRLTVLKPAGAEAASLPEMEQPPTGVIDQARAQGTGDVPTLARDLSSSTGATVPSRVLRSLGGAPIVYEIRPENDLNGAGLVYFARYVAIMNHGERVFLSDRMEPPWSLPLVSWLCTEHRRMFFFANAAPTDRVHVRVSVTLLQEEEKTTAVGPFRVPFKLLVRTDLYRASDKVLMASGVVRKSLNVPGHEKQVLLEADRILRAFA